LPSRDTAEYELNEVSWWAKWVDETVWISKNCYAIFSEDFKDEFFFNRSGFLGIEKVPEEVVEAIENEFVKRKRQVSYVFVEDDGPWDKLSTSFASKGYVVKDRMLVMEDRPSAKGGSATNAQVKVALVGQRSRGKDIQEWTRTYLQAFYGDQRLSDKVNRIMLKVVKDKKASVDPALWTTKDITIEATWCYHVTMWPRIIGMVERGVYPVHKVISAQIKADDVVDKGFKTLLDPSGDQMKVLVKVA